MNSIVNSALGSLKSAGQIRAEERDLHVGQRRDTYLALFVLLFAFFLYLRTMPPSVLDSDSAEFQYMAYILGVPHSTGYPLYILLGKLFTFLPFGDIAFRINLLSVFFSALTAPFVLLTACRLGLRRLPALVATLVLVVTPSMWGGAVYGKAYALHLFLAVLTLYFALRWHQEGKSRDFCLLAFICGLGLTNQINYRFIAPGLLLLLWFNRRRLTRTLVLKGMLLLVLPLLLYSYIPIRANQLISQQDPANKALYGREDAMLKGTVTAYYNNTPEGLAKFVTGLDNIYKLDVKSPLDSANRVDLSTSLLFQQFGIVGVIMAMVGALVAFRRDWRAELIFLGAAGGVGVLAFYLRGISTVYYYSVTYFVLALWIGFGIDEVIIWVAWLRDRIRLPHLASVMSVPLVGVMFFLLPGAGLLGNFAKLDESANTSAREAADQILAEKLPENAVLSAPWEISQPLRYEQFVENRRPDLLVINLSPVGMSEKQFNVVVKNALNVRRPFYLIEFNPDLKTDPGPRSVQAVPLPLLQAPQPQYQAAESLLLPQVDVLGYDLAPDPPQPEQPTRIWIYYRARDRMYPMYWAVLRVSDVTGRPVADLSRFPVSKDFPTYRWYELGEYYRDGWTVNWPVGTQPGLYNLELLWYPYDLETQKLQYDRESRVSLGTFRVGDLTTDSVPHPQQVSMADGLAFRGWNSNAEFTSGAIQLIPGKPLDLDLYWRAQHSLSSQYTVFVHLLDASGKLIVGADSPPMNGLFPTDRWTAGQTVRDRHSLTIPSDLAPGEYKIEVGMYDAATGERLAVDGPEGKSDHVQLPRVRVK